MRSLGACWCWCCAHGRRLGAISCLEEKGSKRNLVVVVMGVGVAGGIEPETTAIATTYTFNSKIWGWGCSIIYFIAIMFTFRVQCSWIINAQCCAYLPVFCFVLFFYYLRLLQFRCFKINLMLFRLAMLLTKTSNCDCALVFDVPLDGSVV